MTQLPDNQEFYEDINGGFIRLDAYMADDLSVVNSARVSFGQDTDALRDKDIGLINYLMRWRHGTPFEHNSFRFHVKCPIFVAREWFRHRIGSFNEFSARYSEMPSTFYTPELENIRRQTGKQGNYEYSPIFETSERDAIEARRAISDANERAYGTYLYLLQLGVAKEQARLVLPVNIFTEFYWTVNARSLMNFLELRTGSAAQAEIREYAIAAEAMFGEVMPHTYKSWITNGRVCP